MEIRDGEGVFLFQEKLKLEKKQLKKIKDLKIEQKLNKKLQFFYFHINIWQNRLKKLFVIFKK